MEEAEKHGSVEDDDDGDSKADPPRRRGKKGAGKLWSIKQYPEGSVGAANWDMENLYAARNWKCPCTDRDNCIGIERFPKIDPIYDCRKTFQTTTAQNEGGLRDAMRKELEQHYSKETRSFGRSFVVGSKNDCCAASAALARGLTFNTYSKARADVRLERPWKDGRKVAKERIQTDQTAYIEAWIRDLRDGMEGSKGRERSDTWHTAKMPTKKRWEEYRDSLIRAKLPVIGSQSLFEKIWRKHTEIRQIGAKKHAKCDTCGGFEVELDAIKNKRNDAHAHQIREDVYRRKEIHRREQRGERDYAKSIEFHAARVPEYATALNIDAPTQDQFDIPVQNRVARDVVKSLESQPKWASKITGVMATGVGMLAYITRCGLGSGPNLTCTTLYLTLLVVAHERGLGKRLNVLFDNTCGDNKNNVVIIFIAWLVYTDVFREASFFCMLKGHTFTILDQSFNTMISQLMQECIYTMGTLLRLMFRFLRPYNVVDVRELHCIWDWTAFFDGHYNKLGGFATSQFGSGMHDFYVRKDAAGDVRLWLRQSSQTTTYFPEGPGYNIFKSSPSGSPPLAKAKPDQRWSRASVESTIRAWYRFMVLDTPEELSKVKSEWAAVFNNLPPDGDTAQLPDEKQLQWEELPKMSAAETLETESGGASGYGGDGVTAALENPAVNPVVGEGRTAADVQRELRAHQGFVRTSAQDTHYPAVFQADFLILQRPSCEMELHRVVNRMIIRDKLAPELSFSTTEYVHTPQPGYLGFWGTFSPKLNPGYTEHDPRNGPMHQRHHNIGRDCIKLYSVKHFTDKVEFAGVEAAKTVVRIAAPSLAKLHQLYPNQVPPVPSPLPDSHTGTTSAARGRGRGAGRGRGRQAQYQVAASGQLQADVSGQLTSTAEGSASRDASAIADSDATEQQPQRSQPHRAAAQRKRSRSNRSAGSDSSVEEQSDVVDSSDEDHAHADNNDDDPPAPIPDGFEAVEWFDGMSVGAGQSFMIWTSLSRRAGAKWHQARVVRQLPQGSSTSPFTHDAIFHSERHPRGVSLCISTYRIGCWVLLQPVLVK
eukprot:6191214-Pleurochrysis_carterae.AAC.1